MTIRQTMAAVVATAFAAAGAAHAAEVQTRLTPAEIAALGQIGPVAGSSGAAGNMTTILSGDPTKAGIYTIRLVLPAHTTVQSHSHKDDRAATVISGDWNIGYGPKFDAAGLKHMPPGSFYTEPAGQPHFATTGDQGVVIQITGYGPSDTVYVDPALDPTRR